MDSIYLFIFYTFRFLVRNTPFFILNSTLSFLSYIVYFLDKKHRKIVSVNINLSFGNKIKDNEKYQISKMCYKNLIYNLADFIRNQGASNEEILSKVTFENSSILEKSLEENKKIIIMTGHYGNWELLPLAIAAKFTPLTVVGRDLDSKVIHKILKRNREQFNINLLSKKGAMRGMIKSLKNNRPVGLLVDQNTKDTEGLLVDFFGKKVRHTPSVAILAKKFNAVIIPTFIFSNNDNTYNIKFFDPIIMNNTKDTEDDIFKCVQEQAKITEQVIREKPNEWFWLHKRWKNQYKNYYN